MAQKNRRPALTTAPTGTHPATQPDVIIAHVAPEFQRLAREAARRAARAEARAAAYRRIASEALAALAALTGDVPMEEHIGVTAEREVVR